MRTPATPNWITLLPAWSRTRAIRRIRILLPRSTVPRCAVVSLAVTHLLAPATDRLLSLGTAGVDHVTSDTSFSIDSVPLIGRAAPPLAPQHWIQVAADGERPSGHPRFGDGHVYVIDFTAEWCELCPAVYPVLGSLTQQFGSRGLRVVYGTVLTGFFGTGQHQIPPAAEVDSLRHYFPAHHPAGPVAIFSDVRSVVGSGYFRRGDVAFPKVIVVDGAGVVRAAVQGWNADDQQAITHAVAAAVH